jgi:UDP-2,3-diacylglucosamine hydrolase
LCEGNHDFFLKEYFKDVLGMEVFEEWAAVDLDGLRVLVSHGDTADRSDRLYLMFRKFLRSRFFYAIQRRLPASLLWTLANMTSNVSKNLNDDNSEYLLGKMLSFAEEKWRENYDAVILGHCHKPLPAELYGGGAGKNIRYTGGLDRPLFFPLRRRQKILFELLSPAINGFRPGR